MRPTRWISITSLYFVAAIITYAQTPGRSPDISNKALITKTTPPVNPATVAGKTEAAALHKIADEFYAWRNEQFPVRSSDQGLHTWDDRLTDYSPAAIAERARKIRSLLDQVKAMKTDSWAKDDQIDWLLFRSQLEGFDFDTRVTKTAFTDPQ